MANEPIWIQNLSGGMDQATDSSMVANNEAPLLRNVSLDQPGNWASRPGSENVGAAVSSTDEIWGQFAYNSTDGSTRKLMVVSEADLHLYDESGGTWSTIDTDEWTANKKVEGVNFLNRLYLGCADGTTGLAYTTGGAITDVVPLIGGDKLAVNKSILSVGGNNIKPNVLLYSDPFTQTFWSATGTCAANADVAGANTVTTTASVFEPDMVGGMLYNTTLGEMNLITGWTSATVVTTDAATDTWDDDTVYIIQNNIKIDGACTGNVAFNEDFVAFDEDAMYVYDPTSNWLSKKPNFGCVNHRTIQVLDGNLIHANREGLYLYSGSGDPVPISAKIRDRIKFRGIWDLVDDSNWNKIASGVQPAEGKYVLSVGTLSTLSGAPASALANTWVVFDINKGAYTVRTYPEFYYGFTTFIDTNGAKDLYGGTSSGAFHKLDTGTSDTLAAGAQNITTEIQTPHHILGKPNVDRKILEYYIKYSCTATVTLTESVDRGAYGALATLPIASTIVVQPVMPRKDRIGVSHSLGFSTTGNLILEAYGALVQDKTGVRRVSV